MIDIASLLQQLTNANTQRANAAVGEADRQQATSNQIAGNNKLLLAGTQNQINQSTDLANETASLQMQRALVNEQAQQTAGLNPEDPNNKFVELMADYNSAEQQRKEARTQYDRLAGATLLSDPLKWLEAQFALPELAAKNNSLVSQRDAAASDLATRQSLLNTQKSVVVANTARQAKELDARQALLQKQQADIRLLEVESKMLSDDAGRRLNEHALRDAAMQIQSSIFDKALSMEELAQRRVERNDARMERSTLSSQRNASLEEKAAAEAAANVNLQRLARFVGLPDNITFQQLDAMNLPRTVKEQLGTFAMTGSLGSTPAQALENIMSLPGAMGNIQSNNPLFAQTIGNIDTAIDGYKATIEADVRRTGGKMSERESTLRGFDLWEDEVMKSSDTRGFSKPMNHPSWDTTYNPRKIDHTLMLDVVGKGNAKFLENNFYVKTLQAVREALPTGSDKFSAENETKALQVVAEHVKRQEISAKDAAAAIASYYNAGKYIQADKTQYGVLAIPLNKRYNVTLPAVGMWGKPVSADLLSPIETEKALLELSKGFRAKAADGVTSNSAFIMQTPGGLGAVSLFNLFIRPDKEAADK